MLSGQHLVGQMNAANVSAAPTAGSSASPAAVGLQVLSAPLQLLATHCDTNKLKLHTRMRDLARYLQYER